MQEQNVLHILITFAVFKKFVVQNTSNLSKKPHAIATNFYAMTAKSMTRFFLN